MTNVTRKIFPARAFPLESAIIYLITNYHPWDHGWKDGSSKSEEIAPISVNHFMRSAEIVFHFLYVLSSLSQTRISKIRSDKPLVLEPTTHSISYHTCRRQPTMQHTINTLQRTNPRAKQWKSFFLV